MSPPDIPQLRTLADLYKYTFTASTMLRAGKATFKQRFIVLARSKSGAEIAPSHEYTLHAFRTANPAEPESARLRLLPSSKLSIPCLQDYNNIGEGKSRLPYAILVTGKGSFRGGRGVAALERDTSWILGMEDQDTYSSWIDALREIVRELVAARQGFSHVAAASQRVSDVAEARAEAAGWRAPGFNTFEPDFRARATPSAARPALPACEVPEVTTSRSETARHCLDASTHGDPVEQSASDGEPLDPIFATGNAARMIRAPTEASPASVVDELRHVCESLHGPSLSMLEQSKGPMERTVRSTSPSSADTSRLSATTSFSRSSVPSLVSLSSSSLYSSRRSSGLSTGSGPFSLFLPPPSPPPKGPLPAIPLSTNATCP